MPAHGEDDLREKVIAENLRVHALENRFYLQRHPEQTNFFQTHILWNTLGLFDRLLGCHQGRILELGCGTGYVHLPLLQRGYYVTGVDLSPEMIGVLKADIPSEHRSRSRLVVGDAETFTATNSEHYDAVVLSAFLHHLYDYREVARKLCERLKPGGLFLVFFEPLKQDIHAPLRYMLHRSLSWLDELFYLLEMRTRGITLFEEDYELSDYQRRFGGIDPLQLFQVLESAGLKLIELKKYCARRYGISAWAANHLLGTANTFNLLAQKKPD
ncbi:MAG: methyltransferase domain-containing protein [Nitrospinota bacterium]|nr:methyltransferase domain-containing protein [Nitrospinota bacterium]